MPVFKKVLLGLAFLALMETSPIFFRLWAQQENKLTPAPFSPAKPIVRVESGDLDGQTGVECLFVDESKARIVSGSAGNCVQNAAVQWESPSAWKIKQAQITDLNHDGKPEVTLLLWRPYAPWFIDRYIPHNGRISAFQNQEGQSCHIILITWKRGKYRELWAGSALSQPVKAFTTDDLDGDGKTEMITLEGNYADSLSAPSHFLTTWEWNGFGFSILERQPLRATHLETTHTKQGTTLIITD